MFVLVICKEPVPGRVKTRLCPPCTPEQAATVAEAALADTFAAAVASGADEVIAALDGTPGPWLPAGVRVVSQGTGTLDRRLATAWSATHGPGLQIGMDTPQVTGGLLTGALDTLATPGTGAVLGAAEDGGWWAIGLHGADDRVFTDVPMSRADTGARQRARLVELGVHVVDLPTLVDVDHMTEARSVAATIPGSAFAGAVDAVDAVDAHSVAGAHR